VCACSQAAAPFHAVAPELWQRYVDLIFDGMRTAAAHSLSQPAPTEEQVRRAHELMLQGPCATSALPERDQG
jgi:hypothetical protein